LGPVAFENGSAVSDVLLARMLSGLHFVLYLPHVIIQLLPPQGGMVPTIHSGSSDDSYQIVLEHHVVDQIKLLYYLQSTHNNSQNKKPFCVFYFMSVFPYDMFWAILPARHQIELDTVSG
jgi:hypothetical protein